MSKYNACFNYDLDAHPDEGDIIGGANAGTLCPSLKSTAELGRLLIENDPVAVDNDVSDIAYGDVSGYYMALIDTVKSYNRRVAGNASYVSDLLNDRVHANVSRWFCVLVNVVVSAANGQTLHIEEKSQAADLEVDVLKQWGRYLLGDGVDGLYSMYIDNVEVAYLSKDVIYCPKKQIDSSTSLLGYNPNTRKFSVATLLQQLNPAEKTVLKSYFNNFCVDSNGKPTGLVYNGFSDCRDVLGAAFGGKANTPLYDGVYVSPDVVPETTTVDGVATKFPTLRDLGFVKSESLFTDYVLEYYGGSDSSQLYCTLPIRAGFDMDKVVSVSCTPAGNQFDVNFDVEVKVMGISYHVQKTYTFGKNVFLHNDMPYVSVYPNLDPELRPYYKNYQWTVKKAPTDDGTIVMRFNGLTLLSQKHANDRFSGVGDFEYCYTDSYLDYLYATCNDCEVGCFCLKGGDGTEAVAVGSTLTIPLTAPTATLSGQLYAGVDFGTGNTQVVVKANAGGNVALKVDSNRHQLWSSYRVREITPPDANLVFNNLDYVQKERPDTYFPTFIQEYSQVPGMPNQQFMYGHYRIPFFNDSLTNSIMNTGFDSSHIYSNLKFNGTGVAASEMNARIYRFLKGIAMELVLRALEQRRSSVSVKASFPLESVRNVLNLQWSNIASDIQTNVVDSQLIGHDFIQVDGFVYESAALCNYIQQAFTLGAGFNAIQSNMVIVDLGQGTADLSFVNHSIVNGASVNSLYGQTSVKFSGYKIVFDSVNQFFKLTNMDKKAFKELWKCPPDDKSIADLESMVDKYASVMGDGSVTFMEKNNVVSMLVDKFGFDVNKINGNGTYGSFCSILQFKYLLLFKTISAFIEYVLTKNSTTEQTTLQVYLYGGASRALNMLIPDLKTGSCIQNDSFGRALAETIRYTVISKDALEDGTEKAIALERVAAIKSRLIENLTIEYRTGAHKFELAEGLLVDSGTASANMVVDSKYAQPTVGFKADSVKNDSTSSFLGFGKKKPVSESAPVDAVVNPTFEGYVDYFNSLYGNVTIEDGGSTVDLMDYIVARLGAGGSDPMQSLQDFYTEQKPFMDSIMSEDFSYPAIKDKVMYMYLTDVLLSKTIG